ncbi:MAG: hypothetical protein CMH54_14600 [Myxococcales bacterium]|nr:hypothetical protein [Myxococcales bacterium]
MRFVPYILTVFLLLGSGNLFAEDTTDTSETSDATGDIPCGSVSFEGCCSQNAVFFCFEDSLQVLNCPNNQPCGWGGDLGYYDCDTDGEAEPTNTHPYLCPGEECEPYCEGRECGPNLCGGTCGACPEGTACDFGTYSCVEVESCGDVTPMGCCSGDTVQFCNADGILNIVNCAQESDPEKTTCGWVDFSEATGFYACTNEATAEPTGAVPMECPASACLPDCTGKECGDDGCGGSCGGCLAPAICNANNECEGPEPNPDTTSTDPGTTGSDAGSGDQNTPEDATPNDGSSYSEGGPINPPSSGSSGGCNRSDAPVPFGALLLLSIVFGWLLTRRRFTQP